MKFEELTIDRSPSYETPGGGLRGKLKVSGPQGEQTVVLSVTMLSRIIELVAEEAGRSAARNAKAVPRALRDAADEPALIEAAANLELGDML